MRWSSCVRQDRHISVGYALAVALAFIEASILAIALSPNVDPDYRAFYIDRTTTCLNRAAEGTYLIGQTVSFQRDGRKQASSIKVCGWSGPAGDGTHSLGETSRLRVNVADPGPDLAATLEMSAVVRPPTTQQRVVVSVNGSQVAKLVLTEPSPRKVSFIIPGGTPTLEIVFDYLDGIPPNRSASDIYKRAIRLVSFKLEEGRPRARISDAASGLQTPNGP